MSKHDYQVDYRNLWEEKEALAKEVRLQRSLIESLEAKNKVLMDQNELLFDSLKFKKNQPDWLILTISVLSLLTVVTAVIFYDKLLGV